MATFDHIKDPLTGNIVNIHTEAGRNILDNYSNISGRTKLKIDDFFKFRQHEYRVLTTKVRPFLRKVLTKNNMDKYINSHLNYNINDERIESNMTYYITTWNKFMYIISTLIKEYKKHKTPSNIIVLNIHTNKLEIKKT